MKTTLFASMRVQRDQGTRDRYEQWLKRDDELHGQVCLCIAYLEDGTICRQPASVLDMERGGMVCEAHAPGAPRRCRVCGCTEDDCRQCIERTGEPCHWIERDLCSACAPGKEQR